MLKMVLVAKRKRPAPAHHRRRTGQHHQRSGHYLKPYWPYLPLALIVTVGVVFSSFLGNLHKTVLGYATDMSISGLFTGTNTQRQANGLSGLSLNEQLDNAAQAKANDMATRNYWSHDTPGGQTPWTFITSAGYDYQTAGENLAYGFTSSADTITGWMNSPEHRANILNNTYVDVGFGIANSSNYQGRGPETIVVAMYASPQPVSSNQPALAGPVSSAPLSQPTLTPTTQATPSTPTTPTSQNVSRIELLASQHAQLSALVVSALASICFAIFIFRHAHFWRRALVKSEAFVIHHKALDITLALIVVACAILTRTAGIIR